MNMMTEREQFEEQAVPLASAGVFDGVKAPSAIEHDFADVDIETPTKVPSRSLLDRITWFRDKRLSGKIHTVFGAFFAVGLAMALILGSGFSELWSRYQNTAQVKEAVLASAELTGTAGELRYNTARFLFERETAVLERQQLSFTAAMAHIDNIDTLIGARVPSVEPDFEALRAEYAEYNSTFEGTIAAVKSAGRSPQTEALAYQISDRGDRLLEQTRAFTGALEAASSDMEQRGVRYFFNMVVIVSVLAALAGIILLIGLSYLSRDFSRRISEVSHGMTRLARGDAQFELEGHDRKDEVGDMLRSLDMFKDAYRQLEEWAQERSASAEAEIQLQQEREREREEANERRAMIVSELASEFEQTVGEVVQKVADASSELNSTATKMARAAEETSERTTLVAEDMNQANAGAVAAAAASDEFSLSINEISQQATSSSELARLANDATTDADTTMSKLAQSAEQVGEIVELIQTIAQRTNLLALNASIEAARGGESGRGFAVVASEVKELAMQTSRATEQVAEQIRDMQDTTGASVSALRSISGQVKQLETTAVSIASAVDQQSVAGQDLARSIDIAARGTEKVSEHITEVRELSLSTGAAASQVLSSANQLEEQANTLNQKVGSFLTRVREG